MTWNQAQDIIKFKAIAQNYIFFMLPTSKDADVIICISQARKGKKRLIAQSYLISSCKNYTRDLNDKCKFLWMVLILHFTE